MKGCCIYLNLKINIDNGNKSTKNRILKRKTLMQKIGTHLYVSHAKAQKNLNIPLFFGLLTIMNSLIRYGLYFVVGFSVLAFGAAEEVSRLRKATSCQGGQRSGKNRGRRSGVTLVKYAKLNPFGCSCGAIPPGKLRSSLACPS